MPLAQHTRTTFVADAPRQVDRTGTTGLRRRHEAEAALRMRTLRRLIAQALGERDLLGLRRVSADSVPFTGTARLSALRQWLRQLSYSVVLETLPGMPSGSAAARHWQNPYITQAFTAGTQAAGRELVRAGVEPPAATAALVALAAAELSRIQLRAYRDMAKVVGDVIEQVVTAVSQHIARGELPRAIARAASDRVEAVGVLRARLVARTAIISAHAEAMLGAYRGAGVEGVTVLAEFVSIHDDRLCDECSAKGRGTFTLDQARNMLPIHPNCRCSFTPVVRVNLLAVAA